MKRKDMLSVIAAIIVAAVISFVVFSKLIFNGNDRNIKAETVEPITSDFKLPDTKIFNAEAIDPTQLIEIGPNANNQPFSSSNK